MIRPGESDGSRRSRGRPWGALAVAILTVAGYATMLFIYSALRLEANVTGFMFVGPDYALLIDQVYPGEPYIHESGYDGQFYFLVASDPLALTDRADRLDLPAYRYGRILYPALAWLTSLGDPGRIPWAMLVLNLLSIGLGSWCVAAWALKVGKSSLIGLALPLLPGVLVAALRDLGEPLAMTLLMLGVWLWLGRRSGLGLASLSLAVLAREICLLPILALSIVRVAQGRWRAAAGLLATGIPYFAWQLYVYSVFGRFSFTSPRTGIGMPFVGLTGKTAALSEALFGAGRTAGQQDWLDALLLCSLATGLVLVWRLLARSGQNRLEGAAIFGGLTLLFICSSPFLLEGYWSFLRVHAMIPLFCIVFLLRTDDRRWWPPLLVMNAGTLFICGSFVAKRFF